MKENNMIKTILASVIILGFSSSFAGAVDLKVTGCNRGACPVAPVVTAPNVTPAPGSPTETKTILQLLLSIQAQVTADLTANLAAAQTPLAAQTAANCQKPATWNSATNTCSVVEVQDPLGAACFAASISLIGDLSGIGGVSAPTFVIDGGPLGLAENARLLDLSAKNAIADISFQGLPQYWKTGCDPWLLDYATQFNLDVAGLAGANALLMKFLPVPLLTKYNLKARM
jgi:hypothetical protein